MLASAALPAEKVTEQENSLNVDEASEVPLPHPGGEDLIAGNAAQGGIKKEPDGGIAHVSRRNRQREDGKETTAC